MQIYYNIEKLDSDTAITLGTFDGLHIGHVKIIKQLVEDAKKRNLKSVVYTFANNPSTITKNNDKPSTILEMKCKKRIIEELGVDILMFLNFDEEQKNISPDSFIKNILIENLKMKHLVVGYDFQFGKKAQGNTELLIQESKKYNYTYDIVEPIKKDFVRVSSTLIRNLLKNGNIEDANYYLGRNYSLEGIVIDGEKIGRRIGFPTANLELDNNFAILKSGVYITRTIIDDKIYYSLTNVGFNPTLKQSDFTVETHILDFNESIYGKIIRVDFYKRIRNEMKFNSIKDLKESIGWDIYTTRKYFNI